MTFFKLFFILPLEEASTFLGKQTGTEKETDVVRSGDPEPVAVLYAGAKPGDLRSLDISSYCSGTLQKVFPRTAELRELSEGDESFGSVHQLVGEVPASCEQSRK
jgi:hypothetical protein